MFRKVIGPEVVCPECGAMFSMNVDIGDNYRYDFCLDCGYKRKKSLDGREVSQEERE